MSRLARRYNCRRSIYFNLAGKTAGRWYDAIGDDRRHHFAEGMTRTCLLHNILGITTADDAMKKPTFGAVGTMAQQGE